MAEEHVGVYAGTFDPITNGHMDIISRAAKHIVDRLIIAVARNPGKGPLFSLEDRVAMVRAELDATSFAARAEVHPFDTLLTDFAERLRARGVTDEDLEVIFRENPRRLLTGSAQ